MWHIVILLRRFLSKFAQFFKKENIFYKIHKKMWHTCIDYGLFLNYNHSEKIKKRKERKWKRVVGHEQCLLFIVT